jgi:hypothetical protein
MVGVRIGGWSWLLKMLWMVCEEETRKVEVRGRVAFKGGRFIPRVHYAIMSGCIKKNQSAGSEHILSKC